MKPDNDFERLWSENKRRILEADAEYLSIEESYRMKSGADWLLFGIPAVAAIVVLNFSIFGNELLNWMLGAVAAIVSFVICVWVKSLLNGSRPLSEVEEDIKKQCREKYEKTGELF